MDASVPSPPHAWRFRTTPFQIFLLSGAVLFAAITPTAVQFAISGVMVAGAGAATAVINLRKETDLPVVFLEGERFEGGGVLNEVFRGSGRLWASPMLRIVVLRPTADALEFGMGYGLGRFLGPWTLRRQDISEVRRVPTRFAAHDYVRIVRFAGAPWTFTTHEPGVILACLEELGYPVARAAG